ncbi:piggyBac transposable element-derived protein 5-like [Nilaparvata lugens]|uniref:piggyBac transposable element-derived protein 5-like n=1 Tax=Nilaparvata lugens TaxID=108931 RepID=UPI00193E8929|nr:piggyBac transposable element-derived protein 5-like [Nilaparvata lugens]
MASDNLNDSDIDALLEGDFSENSDEDFLLDNSDDDPDYIQQELQNNQDSQSEMDETDENQASDEPATIRPAPQPATIRPAPPRRVGNQRLNTFVWDDEDAVPTVEVFNDNSGVTENFNLDNSSSVLDFFSYFVDNQVIGVFKEQTNLYARQKLRKMRSTNTLKANSRMNEWKSVTKADIKKFIGIIFHQSISNRPQIIDHWSKDPTISCNYCPNVMSKNRFLLILSNLHLNDNSKFIKKGEPGHDPLYKNRPLIL